MVLRVHNTMIGQMEEFQPINGNKVGMYVCGINTYDDSHMGHAKSAVTFDVIRRHLVRKGYDVTYVINFTDIEDHCIERTIKLGIPLDELTERYIGEYHKDMGKLGVKKANIYPVASHHMKEIIEAIQKLIDKGFAYESGGEVYFDVMAVAEFGKLSHRKRDDMLAGARVAVDERKRGPLDFVLWKNKKPEEPFWESPWSEGRPGWHIECSVMSMKYLGESFELHGGGTELVFPHHENEIMQSEALSDKTFVKYWLHGGLMNVGDEKMSKSLNNFFTIKDVVKQYDPLVVRFFLLNTHYRKPIDFNQKALEEAAQALGRMQNTLDSVLADAENAIEGEDAFAQVARESVAKFDAAMDEDFNTRDAIASIFEFSREVNKYLESGSKKSSLDEIISTFKIYDEILSIFKFEKGTQDHMMAPLMDVIIDIRQKARAEKNFKLADEIRDRLKELGIEIQDTADDVKWKIIRTSR
ncbi:MAG: cysteine--tRNA ligase [Candidatus Thermoplasmatota archaeon]|nr:cysteine--tRNA ligase [Euryarchaeota archaeon]MBU4031610.1 cysteine--tRNA ligase [Candidatus Thermoplasmatota archaeon]MBU4072395.1 cysteine--tRNA ligase [Candidatus Thermoplasmatota archaeon]MBU4144930.1 cysteine--tRNA ligase [Candidatus Thermoplasmatota archaeon]MBU4591685.1 cysteine--tRNA ligase [Candidatus Thermoplasmatota archaeon]